MALDHTPTLEAARADNPGGRPASGLLMALAQPASVSGAGTSHGGSQGAAQANGGRVSQSEPQLGRAPNQTGHPIAALTPCTAVTSDGSGSVNNLAKFTAPCKVENSALFESGGKVGIGTTSPGGTLDVKGGALIRGTLQLPAVGTATPTQGFVSQVEDWAASAYNSSSKAAVAQHFLWRAEPVGNNTASPLGRFSLLFGAGAVLPAETGLFINNRGLITFAPGQTFPGTGTITGVTAGTDLSGGGTHGNVTLNLNTTATDARYARLAAANTFTTSQKVTGNLSATGSVFGKQLVSTVGTGVIPLSVASTSQVPNLNASLLGGKAASAFASKGANSFSGTQAITGSLSATGALSTAGGAFAVNATGNITTPSVGTAALANGSVTASKLAPDRLNLSAMGFVGEPTGCAPGTNCTPIMAASVLHGDIENNAGTYFQSVSLPQGAVVTAFRVCGRDFDNTPGVNFVGFLKVNPLTTSGIAHLTPTVMATTGSNDGSTSNNFQCFQSTSITNATIDNTLNHYWVEIVLNSDTLEFDAAQIGY